MTLHSTVAITLAVLGIVLQGQALAARMPPSVDRDPAVHARLEAAYAARGAGYQPRTALRDAGKARYVNRLIEEASPYLLQHAHNPVDWHPWSPETLARAVAEGKAIFLSVGYATCHWCHVMEEESFDNEEVAALLNRHFIAIKIDREQQPDLDHLYITATQLQQGQAGWPNSLWLLPDGRPFHTGTYMPRDHFMQVLQVVGDAWADPARRPEIEEVAANLGTAIQRVTQMRGAQSALLDETVYARAADALLSMNNALEGGFSQDQQFPQEGFLLYLLDHWRRTGDEASRQVAFETLTALAAGGIHDHVGGGFHRYATDPNWRTPHFEKMLYNQGLLARAFVEAWEIAGDPVYARAARRTFDYVLRDMTDAQGMFHAAEDADSRNGAGHLEEGAFYVWSPEDAGLALPDPDYAIDVLGLDEPPTTEAGPVAHLDPQGAPDFARLDPVLEALRRAREARVRPLRDDKVIAGWNGLMIRALADGGAALSEPAYTAAAARAGEALWTRLWSDGRLSRLWIGGKAREAGTLEDYAWLGLGYLSVFDATGNPVWRDRAGHLADALWATFNDGGDRLKMAAVDGPLGPIYDNSDGATPAGESAALELLARLARRVADVEVQARGFALRGALSGSLSERPLSRPDALVAVRILDSGESGARRALAHGTVQVRLTPRVLDLAIADGWHVNAHRPGQDWLIGAALDGASATWPLGDTLTLGFSEHPLQVYQGHHAIALSGAGTSITLTLQACSDEICLEPEQATFRLP